ncbi:reverse transcriptase domain-containing protein [Vibrio parahaemolyticus]|uniref:reverse transcriptase domain-containing protein n=1 Tax=Vibrio TaxID=662 RepID=UPI0004059482|nr:MULTISPECIES: reverse transcriptase domain-containing protein [Vibrio]EHR7287304.1 trypsin-like peptidase domain-containing protein [Vibrio parahaemolyticus]EJL7824932.1 trypsin-like peptidase domain-containing protein [Vibrio parahaemolyticus]MCR9950716.1 reverse transcriptase domain-containing protein [Vibrio parahaemolyticus]
MIYINYFVSQLSTQLPKITLRPWVRSLKHCTSVDDLAHFLGFNSYGELNSLVYPHTKNLYKSFSISKKSGGERNIKAPKSKLKSIQRWIGQDLENYYRPRSASHGFINGKSIITNAKGHVDKRFVLNIDLEDFFTTIHFGRVKSLFQAHPLNLSHSVATVLAHICCNEGVLPQGAPTSPIISNMIAYKLDKELTNLAIKNRCTYTRYVDDITFSFTQKLGRLPRSIIKVTKQNKQILGNDLLGVISTNGFRINSKKTRLLSRDQRQEVTGLTVNDKLNIPRTFIRETRSMLYAWKKHGLIEAEEEYIKKYHKKTLTYNQQRMLKHNKGNFFRKIVHGKVNYIKMVRGEDDPIYRKIAYQYLSRIGKPDKDLLKTPHDLIADSTFIIECYLDQGQGTGFLLENIGLVTNEHVIEGIDASDADLLEIYRYYEMDNKRKVSFGKSDKSLDLGILKPTTDFNGIKRLKIGDDSTLSVGQKVTVIGFPQYSPNDTPYINTGKIIQSKVLFGQQIWLLDIPVIHGNSGGPVVNENNEVIGVATRGAEKHDQSTKFHGFIPISRLVEYHTTDT